MAEGCVSDAQEANSYLTLASDFYFKPAFLDYINYIFLVLMVLSVQVLKI